MQETKGLKTSLSLKTPVQVQPAGLPITIGKADIPTTLTFDVPDVKACKPED